MFLFASTALNIGLTVALLILFVFLTIVVNKVTTNKQEANKKGIIWFYIGLLIIFFVFVGISLWLFGLDFVEEATKVWDNIVAGVISKIPAVIGTVFTVFISMFLIKAVSMVLKRASSKEGPTKKRMQTIFKLVNSITKYLVYIIAILVILAFWGVNVLPALAGLGIAGLVVGLGAQSLIKDFISGFFIIFEHHFDVGDIVEINGYKGEIIDIGLKTTKLKNWKQDIKIIANGTIDSLINYSASPSVAIIDFGIAYGENIQKVIDILNIELPKYQEVFPDITETPIVLGVYELANSSVNLRVMVKTKTEKHYGVERGIRQAIKEILDANNIEIPFPQVVVHQPE